MKDLSEKILQLRIMKSCLYSFKKLWNSEDFFHGGSKRFFHCRNNCQVTRDGGKFDMAGQRGDEIWRHAIVDAETRVSGVGHDLLFRHG